MALKRIDAVVRPESFEKVKKALERARCPGLMVFAFQGCGRSGEASELIKKRRFKADLLPKVLLTIISKTEEAKNIADVILKAARTGKVGDGKIFVSPVITAVRIRTGEKGTGAI